MGIQINGLNDNITSTDGSLTVTGYQLSGATNINTTGIITASTANFTGNVSIAGTLTYEDVTSVDSVGIITAQSDVSIADKIIHTGDTDTAIRFPSADTFTVETAGSERLRVTSAGYVGIGTDNPDSTLHLQASSAGTIQTFTAPINGTQPNKIQFQLKDGTLDAEIKNEETKLIFATGSSSTARMTIDSSGKMGLGTATPDMLLDVTGTVTAGGGSGEDLQQWNIGSDNVKAEIKYDDNNATRGYVFGTSTAHDLALQTNNTTRLRINYDGDVAIGVAAATARLTVEDSVATKANFTHSSSNKTALYIESDDTSARIGSTYYAGGGSFKPLAFLTSGTERMRITSDGRLLLGTTTEGYVDADDLTIANSADCGITIRSGSSDQARILFSDATSGTGEYAGYFLYDHSTNALSLGTASTESLKIDSSGRLLVGASSAATAGSLAQYAKFVLRGDTGGSSSAGIINVARGIGAASMSSGWSAGDIIFSDNAGLEFGAIGFAADGTPSGSSTLGRFVIKTTASGATTPTERMRIGSEGQLGIAGANYGTSGQILTSQGSGSVIQWAAPFNGALDGFNIGGTETTYTSGGTTYKVHTFTSTGFFRVTSAMSMNFLIVGGGGGSSDAEGQHGATGGGGAGGMVEGTGIIIPTGKHIITVGSGGAKGGQWSVAGNGGDSVFAYGTTITAKGGGGGTDYDTDGQDGGSGAGGPESAKVGGSSTQSAQNSGVSDIAQFGNDGGDAANYQLGAGGGGGAGGAGQDRSAGGAGGSGRANSITGSSVTYAAGGAGGATGVANGTDGTDERGNGASGATSSSGSIGTGAAGGSGIIIIRYVFI